MRIVDKFLAQKNTRVLYVMCMLNHNVRNYVDSRFNYKTVIKAHKFLEKAFVSCIGKYDKHSYRRKIVARQLPEISDYLTIQFFRPANGSIRHIEPAQNADFRQFIESYYTFPHPGIVLVKPQNLISQLLYIKKLYLEQNKLVYLFLFSIKELGVFFDLENNCYYASNSSKKYMFIGETLELLRD